MGGGSWSDAAYTDRATYRSTTGTPTFAYDHAVKSGVAARKAHDTLDPKKIKGVRESRDSKEHPESNAITVALDVTGSMGAVVHAIHKKLPTLMGLLTRKNYIPHPQVQFMAVGDATVDSVPLQVGQYESGIEVEDNLSNVVIEGGGGGSNHESYELAAYAGARKTSIDCFEKRNKRGYFFFIGDELTYNKVSKRQIEEVFGDTIQGNIDTEDVFKELAEKFNVFFVLPEGASNGRSSEVVKHWEKLVGAEHVLKLANAEAVAELIALQVGLCEGTTDVDAAVDDLKDSGTSNAIVKVVKDSLSTKYAGGSIAKTSGTVPGGKSGITRL